MDAIFDRRYKRQLANQEGVEMSILIDLLRVIHIVTAILMAWPAYALVAVNQRVWLAGLHEYHAIRMGMKERFWLTVDCRFGLRLFNPKKGIFATSEQKNV